MKFTINEVINTSIMSSEPTIIVEGLTDLQTYNEISKRLVKKTTIKPVEFIEGYGEGCREVVRAISDAENNDDLKKYIKKNIFGIIDKDVLDFREDLPESENIIILDFYSIESYFISEDVIGQIVNTLTYIPKNDQIDEVSSFIFSRVISNIDLLYYGSLDALMTAKGENSSPLFGYSDGFGRLKDQSLARDLMNKKQDLDIFASRLGISKNPSSMKLFIKGKVFIAAFSEYILEEINTLTDACANTYINQCGYCGIGLTPKCLYRKKATSNAGGVKLMILSQFPEREFKNLIRKINTYLSPTPH
ncbi:DUF4435 domain-containing protein [Gluconobacter oxydans]|uniref:DUF4435 domain-containing protein n=1 Tax=Gluconobacter oxydans TaxID=442 RepID=UPI0039EABFEB